MFVATHPDRSDLPGPVIVGWYRNATLYREEQSRPDENDSFRVETTTTAAKVIPCEDRSLCIPRGTTKIPGIGQSNIYYTRDSKGCKRNLPWLDGVLAYVAEMEDGTRLDPESAAEIESERQSGFQSDPRIRKALEMRAMTVVRSFFSEFSLRDTSNNNPYDFSYDDGGLERYIEVKGSQQSDPAIILTRNEVDFARKHLERIELCVVHSIVVRGAASNPIATGGILVRFQRWNPDQHELTALQYQCILKR